MDALLHRSEIERMWKYKLWKSNVEKICQHKCVVSGATENLTFHHIESLSLIIKRNQITSKERAIKCGELWNKRNGVLVREDIHNSFHYSCGDSEINEFTWKEFVENWKKL